MSDPDTSTASPPSVIGGRWRLVLLPLLFLPSLVWVALDQRVWNWDPAWYGIHTLRLWERLVHRPWRWPAEMLQIQQVKAPGLSWIGQFFVPLGDQLGSVDVGLLLSVLLTQFLVLVILYQVILELSGDRPWVALAAVLSLAAAPLFVALSHAYYTEPLQSLAVAWFILIMLRSTRWRRSRILAQLAGATGLAMLAKASSPLYCAGPALVALAQAFRARRDIPPSPWTKDRPTRLSLALAAPLVVGAIGWYSLNGLSLARFVRGSASSPMYGAAEGLGPKLFYWLQAGRFGCLPLWLTMGVVGALLVLALVCRLRHRRPWRLFDTVAVVALAEIVVVLLVFSLNVNQTTRYLLPALIFLPLLIGWGLAEFKTLYVPGLVLVAFALQYLVVHSQALGLTPLQWQHGWNFLRPVERGDTEAREFAAIIERTCQRRSVPGGVAHVTMIGVQLPRLNQDSANYTALKQAPEHRRRCEYWGTYLENLPKTLDLIEEPGINAVVTVDPDLTPIPDDALNAVTRPLLEHLRQNPNYREERLPESPRILIFWHLQ